MMSKPLTITAIYSLAFVVALLCAYAVTRLQVNAIFSPGMAGSVGVRLLMPPLAGIAAFSLIYGLLVGRAMRLKFWLVAVALVVAAQFLSYGMIGMNAGITAALSVPIITIFLVGLWFAQKQARDE